MARSPRRRIRLVTVADGLKDCLNPVGSTRLRQLDTSNGCQDHTVLPYAASPVVCTLCLLTDQSPPCEHDHAPDAAASTASRPNVRDDGQRPSLGTGWRVSRTDLGQRRSRISFQKGLDTRVDKLPVGQITGDCTLPWVPKLESAAAEALSRWPIVSSDACCASQS